MKTALFLLSIVVAFTAGYVAAIFSNPLASDNNREEDNREDVRVTSIGGVFFKSEDPVALREWYGRHLGLGIDEYGTNFRWRTAGDPAHSGFTQWSPFSASTTYFEPSEKDFMINYRVRDISSLVEKLRSEGVTVVDEIEEFDYGRFVHIMDPEGNKIELWEPDDKEYEKLVDGVTW